MIRPTLKDIYGKQNNYQEIKACNLQNDYIKPNDYLSVRNFSFKLLKNYINIFIMTFILNLLISFLFYNFIKSTQNIFNKEFLFLAIMLISFFSILCYAGYMIYCTINISYKKAQYGIIKTKFFLNKSQNDRIIKNYYAHVIFPNYNTLIRNVNCNEDVYHSISEGSEVLVVSFNNKSAHIVLI